MIVESKKWSYQLKDSAADSKLKLLKDGETFGVEKPGGEKRIHIGSATNASDFDQYFFPEDASDVVFEVSKVDLIQYLLSAHDEFMNPSQSYRMPICDYYDDLLKATLAIEEENFSIRFVKNCDEKRYYIARPSGDPLAKNYFYISNICLPLISKFNFIRNKYVDGGYKFYLKPVFVGQLKNVTAPVVRNDCPLQTIFYGAPGTGKSHNIDVQTNDDNSIRTTFHPDTDFATFVGTYKPMMEIVDEYALDATGKTHQVVYPNGKKSVAYKYEPQAFLKAYVEAWKKWLGDDEDKKYYLVIEEINRGNCAQIFGDLFQLLDREDDGYSSYAILPESAITKYLAEEAQSADGTKFSDLVFSDVIKKRKDGATKIIATADDLKAGKRLVLPPNLHIWATMNTSDQSLFPIDSAFKRRWDWEYVPIKRADKEPEKEWIIKVTHGGKTYWCYWWEFLEAINHQIEETTHSEDKQLGYFFAKPKAGENFISTDTFVNKVIFYLWNDVFKDEDSAVFQYDNNKVEDISINRSGAMYFRHFMENKDEMIHYFINQLFAMGKDSTPVVPIDYLKNDADSKVIEHLPKMREGDPVKLDDEAVDEETSEGNGISVRKSDNIDNIVFSIPEYKKMSEKLTQALKGNVFKYSKNSMDMKMGDMPISYARLSMAYSSKKTDIKLYIPAKSAYNQSIECYNYMNLNGVEGIIAEVSERNNLEYELISKDIAENKVLGWRIKYPMTFSESGDNIMDGDVTKIVEIVKELQKRITPIMNEFSKNGK